jgi:hypothetical protein
MIGDLPLAARDVDVGLAPDKMVKDIPDVALLKAPELLGYHALDGVGIFVRKPYIRERISLTVRKKLDKK